MSEYKPVTVEAAIGIADAFEKDIVVVFAIDHAHQLCHYTTFGRTPRDKIDAAAYGDAVAKIISRDELGKKRTFEDFRLLDTAEHKARADALLAACQKFCDYYASMHGNGGILGNEITPWLDEFRQLIAKAEGRQ